MQDKVCLVTGANSGIGKETALALAQRGATVVMVARSRTRGEAALAEVRQACGHDRVALLLADLSVQAEVRQLAAAFRRQYARLDVLVNNAGALFMSRELSADGIEKTFALNHLGYFLLTTLLLDMLRASAPARIINVSSDAHFQGQLDFDDLQLENGYAGFRAYSLSKLANVLFTRELARRLAGSGVTANAMHPGFVGSNFAKNNGLLARLAMTLLRPFARTPEQGAETVVYLATSPEVADVSGAYFADKKAKEPAAAARDPEAAQRLWAVSEALAGSAAAG
ncbi:MAG: SDR family oxidoreductase [Anaerolineales bacterium]|nr:SDR family oxidoreductase [Anaerolineales bacterium]